MLSLKRAAVAVAATLSGVVAPLAVEAVPAQASHNQLAMFEADANLQQAPQATMNQLRSLGVGTVRVDVEWSAIAPDKKSMTKPAGFDSANPASYPAGSWSKLDAIVAAAQADGIQLDFLVTGGAPYWADGHPLPSSQFFNPDDAWKPSVTEYNNFVHAVALRYGSRVHFWEIYNEPNFGEDLGPEAIDGSRYSVAPMMYRKLVDAAWHTLNTTAPGRKTIVIGQLAARGLGPSRPDRSHPQGLPGDFGQTKPLQFIRTLYCVDSRYRPLRGTTARMEGCPTNTAGSRRFRAQNPAFFSASGFGIHPYPQGLPPTQELSHDPDFVAFNHIPQLERALDRVNRVYGSGKHLAIYNNEYGYITQPPVPKSFRFGPGNSGRVASPTTAALYINWAEYLSWRDPRVASTMQYQLTDPACGPSTTEFCSGLLTVAGAPKPAFYAYRMPLFLPSSRTRRGRSLEVWGDVRAEHVYGNPHASIQWTRTPSKANSWRNVAAVTIRNGRGYFDIHVKFPGSGAVRLAWAPPHLGVAWVSRTQTITVR